MRVQMVESRIATRPGERRYFLLGRLYDVEPELASAWLEEDAAIDPEAPPSCAACGETFASRRAAAAHRVAVHPAPAAAEEEVAEAEAEPLDESDPAAKELLRLPLAELMQRGHALGIAVADVRGTGPGHRQTKSDWARVILHARKGA